MNGPGSAWRTDASTAGSAEPLARRTVANCSQRKGSAGSPRQNASEPHMMPHRRDRSAGQWLRAPRGRAALCDWAWKDLGNGQSRLPHSRAAAPRGYRAAALGEVDIARWLGWGWFGDRVDPLARSRQQGCTQSKAATPRNSRLSSSCLSLALGTWNLALPRQRLGTWHFFNTWHFKPAAPYRLLLLLTPRLLPLPLDPPRQLPVADRGEELGQALVVPAHVGGDGSQEDIPLAAGGELGQIL